MQIEKGHVYRHDYTAHREQCICGKRLLDPIHATQVKVIRGTAKPDYVSRERK